MSGAYYLTRLLWDGHTGQAKHDGVSVELRHAPAVGIEHLRYIEYCPGVRIFECRVGAEARRDLTAEERAACLAYLARMADAARAETDK